MVGQEQRLAIIAHADLVGVVLAGQFSGCHAGAYFRYMKRAVEKMGSEAKVAFAKIGVLMASSGKSGKPLHPTNLHVNKGLFPNDTVQSKLPDPEWLQYWLDSQIQFDKMWENRVVNGILKQMSALFDRTFETSTDLNRFRKELLAGLATPAAPVTQPA